MENAPIGMSLVRPDGQTIYVNQAFADMFRRSRSELLTLTTRDLVAPEMLAEAEAQISAVLRADRDSYQAERLYVRSDGTRFWGLIAVSTIPEGDGAPPFIITQITDIDSAKRSEAAIAEAESRWNFALESAGQGVWDHDLRTEKSFYSRMWKLMRGIDPEGACFEIRRRRGSPRVHPEDRDYAREQERRLVHGEVDYHEFEYRERHRDGHYIWILSRGRPVEWQAGRSVARVIGTDTDVTRIKAAETHLGDWRSTRWPTASCSSTRTRSSSSATKSYPRMFPKTPRGQGAGARR